MKPVLRRNWLTIAILAISGIFLITRPAQAARMTWYGPGFYGHTTACGKTLTQRSLWVAALTPAYAHCGQRLTLYTLGGKYHVRVQDRGAYRTDGIALDAAPGLRARIGFYGVINVTIQRGWI